MDFSFIKAKTQIQITVTFPSFYLLFHVLHLYGKIVVDDVGNLVDLHGILYAIPNQGGIKRERSIPVALPIATVATLAQKRWQRSIR